MTLLFQLPSLPDPIPKEYTWSINLGEIKIGDSKIFEVEFPDNFFKAIKAKTYVWEIVPETNKQKHSCIEENRHLMLMEFF